MPKVPQRPAIERIEKPEPEPRTLWLGIDPGKYGGFALLDGEPGSMQVTLASMPETELDLWNLFKSFGVELYSQKPSRYNSSQPVTKHYCHRVICCIEKISTSPQMGVVSAGSFMYGFGRLKMALTAREDIPFDEIRPQDWQKALGITPRKKGKGKETDTQWKDRLRKRAQQLFPTLSIWQETLTKQRAICDALLIAEFCRRSNLVTANLQGSL